MFKISFQFHQKNDNNWFCAAQASQQLEQVNESGESISYSVYF